MDKWVKGHRKHEFSFSLSCVSLQHHPRFWEDSCQLNYSLLSRLRKRRRKTKKWNLWTRQKNPQHRHEGLGTMLQEDPRGTTQKRGIGGHAKDDPGGCCDSSVVLGFCWSSYLPIIVECCWTAASRSLSSIVHSPISEHPEKTRAQLHSVQIPPKKKDLYFPSCFSLPLVLVSLQSVRFELKNASVTGCCYRPSPLLSVSLCLCALSGWLCAERAAPVSVLLCVPSAPTTLPHFSLSWESEGLITISPPIFDLQISLMGCALRLDGGRLDLMSCQR